MFLLEVALVSYGDTKYDTRLHNTQTFDVLYMGQNRNAGNTARLGTWKIGNVGRTDGWVGGWMDRLYRVKGPAKGTHPGP